MSSTLVTSQLVQAGCGLALLGLTILLRRGATPRAVLPWLVSWAGLAGGTIVSLISSPWRATDLGLAFIGGLATLFFAGGFVAGVLELKGTLCKLPRNRILFVVVALNLACVPIVLASFVDRSIATLAFWILLSAIAFAWSASILVSMRSKSPLYLAYSGILALGGLIHLVTLFAVTTPEFSAIAWGSVGANAVAGLFSIIAILEATRQKLEVAAGEAEHMAYHDRLTALPNRALFFDRLEMALNHAKRHKHKFAVLFVDLDRFKYVNDSLGHTAGDEILVAAATRLSSCVRSEDTVARFGGDEFIVLLRIIGRIEDAGKVAQKIIDVMNPAVALGKREIVSTASVGIAVFPNDGEDAEELVKNADTAMYRAKEAGRDAYRYYTPAMNARTLEMLELESDLRRALARDQLRIHYQPLIDVEQGRIYGLEALLRWEHPKYGLLSPDKFIATAESTGLILPIGEWVLRESCKQIRVWRRHLGMDLVVSVNLSPRQFEQPDLVAQVSAAISEAGLRPENLELEITESNAMTDVNKTIVMLKELKTLGVRIAIDDFGTGYSSLSYLKQFPIDTLKLDQSFVREITVPEDGAIARGVIAMAHSLGLRVVAEGVETLGQLEFLKANSCDRLQGFLFSRPLDAEMLERFVAHGQGAIRVA